MLTLKGFGCRMPRQRYSRPEPKRSKDKPCKWVGEWWVYHTSNGTERRKHHGPIVLGLCSQITKADAQTELNRRVEESKKPAVPAAPANGTVASEFESFLRLSKQWEPETFKTHRSIVEKHISPAIGDLDLSAVTREQLQELLNDLAGRMSKSVVKKARTLLGTLFSLASEDGKVQRNPMARVKMPRTREVCRRYLTEEECGRLIAVSTGRDRLILRIAITLGLRPGEIFALRRDDIEAGRIRIDEASREGKLKRPKTEASAAYVVLPPGLGVELRHWLQTSPEDPQGFVFPSEVPGHPLRQNNWRKRNLQAIAEVAGIEGVTFQSLRRTTATHAQEVGTVKDAQAMLRHANPEMTVGTYMQAIPDSVRRAVEALETKIGGGTVQ